MRLIILTYLIYYFLPVSCFGVSKLDSLKSLIENSTDYNEVIESKKKLVYHLLLSNVDSSLYVNEIYISECRKKGDTKNLGDFLYYKAFGLINKGKSLRAIPVIEDLELLLQTDHDPSKKSKLYSAKANLHLNQGDFHEAIESFNKQMAYTKNKAKCSQNIAACYHELNQFAKAIEYFSKAITLYNSDNKRSRSTADEQTILHINMAQSFLEMDDIKRANLHARKSFMLIKENNNTTSEFNYYYLVAQIKYKEGKIDSAYHHINYIIDQAKELNEIQSLLSAYSFAALISSVRLKNTQFLFYIEEIQNLFNRNQGVILPKIYNYIAEAYFHADDYKNAISYSNKSISAQKYSANIIEELKSVKLLAKAFSAQNIHDKANLYFRKSIQISDAIDSKNLRIEIEKYLLDQKLVTQNKEIKRLNKEQKAKSKELKISRIVHLLSVVILIFLLINIYQFHNTKTIREKLYEENNIKKDQEHKNAINHLLQIKEKEAIQQVLSSIDKERERLTMLFHDDIGANLAALKFSIINNANSSKEAITEQINSIYYKVKSICIGNMIPDYQEHSFEKAIEEIISNYSGIDIDYSIESDTSFSSIKDESKINLLMILQESITNAIKYSGSKHLTILLHHFHHELTLIIEDSGIGFSFKNSNKGTGLKSMMKRAKALNGDLVIDSVLGRGTLIKLTVLT